MAILLAQRDLDWTNLLYILVILVLPALNSLGQWIRSRYEKKGEQGAGPKLPGKPTQYRTPPSQQTTQAATRDKGRTLPREKKPTTARARKPEAKPVADTSPWDALEPILGDLGPVLKDLQKKKSKGKAPNASPQTLPTRSRKRPSRKPPRRVKPGEAPKAKARPVARPPGQPPAPPPQPQKHELQSLMERSDAVARFQAKPVVDLPLSRDDLRKAIILKEVLDKPVGIRPNHVMGEWF